MSKGYIKGEAEIKWSQIHITLDNRRMIFADTFIAGEKNDNTEFFFPLKRETRFNQIWELFYNLFHQSSGRTANEPN